MRTSRTGRQLLATAAAGAALTLLAACGGSDSGTAGTTAPTTVTSGTDLNISAGNSTVPIATGTTDPTGVDGGSGGATSTSAEPTSGASASGGTTGTEVARAQLATPDGTEVGTVTFSTEGSTMIVRASVTGLEPGFKGFHVHTIGKCEPNSANPTDPAQTGDFLSAGGHLKSEGENHAGHDGDLSSLQVTSGGTAELTTTTDALPLDALLDADGSAVMVHLGPDNFGNIPTRYAPTPDAETLNTGDSGGRAACGVVEAA